MWINVPKPNTSNYTNTNPQGREQYNQSDITYDSATTYYDGINPNQWSDVTKPTTSAWTNVSKPT